MRDSYADMSVARPTDTGCRLVRIKRVPSSEFHNQAAVSRRVSHSPSGPAQTSRCLPPVAVRVRSATAGGYNHRMRMAHQRHSELWLGSGGHCAPAESSSCPSPTAAHLHQVGFRR